jgi:hypothetical protein
MKKRNLVLLLLLLPLAGAWSAGIDVTLIVSPVGGSLTLDTTIWTIDFANDGTSAYQQDSQGTLTVKSGNSQNFHVDFSSQNAGYAKKGSDLIPYYIKITLATAGYTGIVGSPEIMAGYVPLTSTQTITCNKKTPKNGIALQIGMMIPTSSDFYESGSYTDVLTISYASP